MSIRLRLTLLYSVILALTLVVFGGAVYLTVARVMLTGIEEALATEAQDLLLGRELEPERHDHPRRFVDPQTYVQTLDADRQVTGRTTNLGDYVLPLSDSGWQTCQSGQDWTEVVTTDEGRLLVYSRPLVILGQSAGVLQVARSLVEYDQSLGALRNILAVGGLLATFTTLGLGWVLAGATLRPIGRLTHAAQVIGNSRDFSHRLTHLGPNDEIGQLTATLNTMLTELQSAYQQLQQALHTQRRFVADASHELRTPLTTIRGNLGLLGRQPAISAEDQKAVLSDAIEESDRLIRLINNLLMLARADSGLVLAVGAVSLQPLIDELCRQAHTLAPERLVDCDNALTIAVRADRDALKQVLLILLDNAIKYTPPHGTISVRTALHADQIQILVQDTGPGIDPAALPHIFERFYRVETSRTSAGAGLGLAIAKELTEAQGGTITVESEAGQGTIFRITLPIHKESVTVTF